MESLPSEIFDWTELTPDQLKAEWMTVASRLADPLSPDKPLLLTKYRQIHDELLARDKLIYFCGHCKFQHKTGQIYHDHKPFAQMMYSLPPVKIHPFEQHYLLPLQKTHHYQAENHLKNLLTGTSLELEMGTRTIIVKYQGNPVGEIPGHTRKYQNIRTALEQNTELVRCVLDTYQPREIKRTTTEILMGDIIQSRDLYFSEIVPETALVSIQIVDVGKYNRIFAGLLEMVDYHSDILPAFIMLGQRGMKDLELLLQSKTPNKAKIAEILDQLHRYFKIPTKERFSIML
jgi:hypothetical protein